MVSTNSICRVSSKHHMNAKSNLKYLVALKIHIPTSPRLVNTSLWLLQTQTSEFLCPFLHTDLLLYLRIQFFIQRRDTMPVSTLGS